MRALLAAALVLLALPATASADPSLVPVDTFAGPVHVTAPPADTSRLFVVERAGRVQVVVGGQKAATPFLDLTADVRDSGGEEGLLSIAFAPDYETSGRFFVFYTNNAGDLTVRAGLRSGSNPNRGDAGAVLFTIEHSQADNHNGGQLAFGPDGALYVSTGDGGTQGDPEGDAQNPSSLLGKILRVDLAAPSSPVVWALGLRNPWRFSFDRVTGEMVIGDVGGGLREEVDVAPAGTPAGRNYGWPACEGDQPTPCIIPGAHPIPPTLSLPRDQGYSGVIGGFVVRDPGLPTLLDRYVFGDLGKGSVLSVALGAETAPRAEPLPVSAPSSFGEDACGHVYVASLGNGVVSRIQDGAVGACVMQPPPPPGPGDQQPPPSRDTVGCKVNVGGAASAQRILRRGKRLRLTLRADERCTATLRAKRFRTKQVTLQPNANRIVRLTPTKKGLRRMRRALSGSERNRLRITVRISARDAAGNPSTKRIRRTVR